MVKQIYFYFLPYLESNSALLVCKLAAVIATDPGRHSAPRLFQVKGIPLSSISIHFLWVSIAQSISGGDILKF